MIALVGTALTGLVTASEAAVFGTAIGIGGCVRVADFSHLDLVRRFLDATTFLKDPTRGPQVVGIAESGSWVTGPFLDEGDFREDVLAASRGLVALVAQGGPRWLTPTPWLVRPLLSERGAWPRTVVGFAATRDDGIFLSRVTYSSGFFGEYLRVAKSFIVDQREADVTVQQEVRRGGGDRVHGALEVRLSRRDPVREQISGQLGAPLGFGQPILSAYRSAAMFMSQP